MNFKEIQVAEDEGISTVHFCNNILQSTTWAGKIHYYNTDTCESVYEMDFKSPLLCGAWVRQDLSVAGSTDGTIFFSNNSSLKAHESGISSLSYWDEKGILVSSSWDQTVKMWDLNQPDQVVNFNFKEKIMFSGISKEGNIVAYGHRNTVFIIDPNNPDQIEKRISSIGKQIRAFEMCQSEPKWAIGSIDGRIAIEYFGDLKHQAQRFSFSCHRHDDEEEKFILYPVNSLSFHPVTGILTSGDSKGSICFWDLENKRKLTELHTPYQNSISSLCYNNNGTILAIAYSYMWDKGNVGHPNDTLLLCAPTAQCVTPLARKHEE
ncbi:WD40 repeat-containing protein [Histomonas meleagridis]|uniref:WD40 repeat-containing protein n=1 Tax=Histomonas meleagridis TaxID=135588 RepID=UPI00355A08B9|nr:WD40 repeat-containing protein [Histomonas meleagridis]KAH0800640.1 WD40 repeat-containing protein [Histomonas meleagridis]